MEVAFHYVNHCKEITHGPSFELFSTFFLSEYYDQKGKILLDTHRWAAEESAQRLAKARVPTFSKRGKALSLGQVNLRGKADRFPARMWLRRT
jgi:hypothetical protein